MTSNSTVVSEFLYWKAAHFPHWMYQSFVFSFCSQFVPLCYYRTSSHVDGKSSVSIRRFWSFIALQYSPVQLKKYKKFG